MKTIVMQSNGAGQQSIAMFYQMAHHFDFSIFVDPGSEDPETYYYLKHSFLPWCKKNKVADKFIWIKSNLTKDLLLRQNSTGQRFATIPAFTENGGMLRRQCTSEYKINPILKYLRNELLNLPGRKPFPPLYQYMAITMEEFQRMSRPSVANFTNMYPYCAYYIHRHRSGRLNYKTETRGSLLEWYRKMKLDIPPKSACTFCPYQSNRQWKKRVNDPKQWPEILKIDEAIRFPDKGKAKNTKEQAFLHRSQKPIDEVDFGAKQTDLFQECEGYCDI